jgi:hypothetical protein
MGGGGARLKGPCAAPMALPLRAGRVQGPVRGGAVLRQREGSGGASRECWAHGGVAAEEKRGAPGGFDLTRLPPPAQDTCWAVGVGLAGAEERGSDEEVRERGWGGARRGTRCVQLVRKEGRDVSG